MTVRSLQNGGGLCCTEIKRTACTIEVRDETRERTWPLPPLLPSREERAGERRAVLITSRRSKSS
jgi:hypothetical protein